MFMAAQRVASREVFSSTELVSYGGEVEMFGCPP
jgi:hypothetical protein